MNHSQQASSFACVPEADGAPPWRGPDPSPPAVATSALPLADFATAAAGGRIFAVIAGGDRPRLLSGDSPGGPALPASMSVGFASWGEALRLTRSPPRSLSVVKPCGGAMPAPGSRLTARRFALRRSSGRERPFGTASDRGRPPRSWLGSERSGRLGDGGRLRFSPRPAQHTGVVKT